MRRCAFHLYRNRHTPPITVREMPPCRMGTRGRPRVVEAQAVNEGQPQLATAAEITELRQVVQQQAEMIQIQAEEARNREEELTHRQN